MILCYTEIMVLYCLIISVNIQFLLFFFLSKLVPQKSSRFDYLLFLSVQIHLFQSRAKILMLLMSLKH